MPLSEVDAVRILSDNIDKQKKVIKLIEEVDHQQDKMEGLESFAAKRNNPILPNKQKYKMLNDRMKIINEILPIYSGQEQDIIAAETAIDSNIKSLVNHPDMKSQQQKIGPAPKIQVSPRGKVSSKNKNQIMGVDL